MLELNPLAVYSRSELLDAVSVRALRRAVARGELRRLRRDVYVSEAMPDSLQHALSIGGSACCTSALAEWGAWRPPGTGLHIAVPHNASRLAIPAASPITVHWSMEPVSRPRSTRGNALARLIGCLPRAETIAVIDSALRAGIASVEDVHVANSRASARRRIVLDDLDARAESGIESLVRVALRDPGLAVQPQVWIPGVGRVDLLVEGRVIVEVDGREWHRGEQERDYRRDLEAQRQGFRVVRVDYRHAIHHRPLVVAAVERATSNVGGEGVTLLRSSDG